MIGLPGKLPCCTEGHWETGLSLASKRLGTEGPLRLGRKSHPQVRWLNQESAAAFAQAECQLWHLMVLAATVPLFAPLALWQRIAVSFVVAYLSYQVMERPFLQRRVAPRAW
jgi:hypothetical protein